MNMITKIADNVWKINAGSNMYFLDLHEKIIIDTGERRERRAIEQFLSKVVDFEKVDKVIFTHLHYDHIGNFDLFPHAQLLASQEEIDSLAIDPAGTVLNDEMLKRFAVKLSPLSSFDGLEIIKTPGHTAGSICIWYPEKKVLFTGDTVFSRRVLGRTDLATSKPELMGESLSRLMQYPALKICPGHDY